MHLRKCVYNMLKYSGGLEKLPEHELDLGWGKEYGCWGAAGKYELEVGGNYVIASVYAVTVLVWAVENPVELANRALFYAERLSESWVEDGPLVFTPSAMYWMLRLDFNPPVKNKEREALQRQLTNGYIALMDAACHREGLREVARASQATSSQVRALTWVVTVLTAIIIITVASGCLT